MNGHRQMIEPRPVFEEREHDHPVHELRGHRSWMQPATRLDRTFWRVPHCIRALRAQAAKAQRVGNGG